MVYIYVLLFIYIQLQLYVVICNIRVCIYMLCNMDTILKCKNAYKWAIAMEHTFSPSNLVLKIILEIITTHERNISQFF